MPSPHVGDEKDKRAIVYKTKEKEEKGIMRACLKKLMAKKTMLIAVVALH